MTRGTAYPRRGALYPGSEMASLLLGRNEGELIEDPHELAYHMGRIALAAPEIGLPQLRYGFHGYAKVTETVAWATENNVFQHPEKMLYTMPRFAERAIAPIRQHLRGEVDHVGAWAPMYYDRSALTAPPALAMYNFLTFHVRCDLPPTLYVTQTTLEHKQDYTKEINIILSEVAQDLMPQYVTVNPFFERMKLPQLGLRLVLKDLFDARDEAWDAFEEYGESQEWYSRNEDEIDNRLSHGDLQPRHPDEIVTSLNRRAARRMRATNHFASFVMNRVSHAPAEPWDLPKAA